MTSLALFALGVGSVVALLEWRHHRKVARLKKENAEMEKLCRYLSCGSVVRFGPRRAS